TATTEPLTRSIVLTALSASAAGAPTSGRGLARIATATRLQAPLRITSARRLPAATFASLRRDERGRRRERRVVRMTILAEQNKNPLHISTRLGVRRDAAILVHDGLAGVVRRRGKRDFPTVIRQQPAQVRQSAAHVVADIVGVFDAESRGGVRDELHQPARV